MKRKAEDNYDREYINSSLRSQEEGTRNGTYDRNGNNLVQSEHKRKVGRLFVSPLKRLEQAGKIGWGSVQSLNQSTSDDISRRRIVKLKLPSEILLERSQIIEERGSPEKMEILDSPISDSKQNLDSTSANDQNVTSTSFSVFKSIAPVPVTQQQQPETIPTATTTTTTTGLFGASIVQKESVQETQSTKSIFGFAQKQEVTTPAPVSVQEEKPAGGLFGSMNTTTPQPTSIFASKTPQPTSIFASTTPQGGSLFSNQASKPAEVIKEVVEEKPKAEPEPEKEKEAPKGGLFGNLSGFSGNKPMSGLFNIGNNTPQVEEKKETIQEEQKTPSGGPILNVDKSNLFGAAPIQTSQTKPLFGSNIVKNDAGMPKAGLFGNLMDNKSPASIFGGKSEPPKETKMEIIPEKAPQEQEKPKAGLFGNLSSGTGAGLFANQQKTETPTGALFGNQQKTETAPVVSTQIQEEKPKGFFGGFTSNQQKTETKTDTPAEKPKGIFGNLPGAGAPIGGLFGNQQKTETPAGGLFGNQQKAEPTPAVSTQIQEEKPKGVFGGFISNQPKTETPAGGLFGNQQKTEATPAVSTQIQEEKPKGLFGGFISSQPKTETPAGGFFGNQQKTETKDETPAEKSKTGLLGNFSSGTGAGLFGNQQKTEPTPAATTQIQEEKPKTGGLFGGLTSNQPASGLFGNQQKTETPTPAASTQIQEEKPKPAGLFGGFTSSQAKTETPAGGLFGNQQKTETPTPAASTQIQEEKPKGLFGGLPANSPVTTTTKNESPKRGGIQPSGLGSFGGAPHGSHQKTETASPPKPSTTETKPSTGKPGLFSGLASTQPTSFLSSVNQSKTEESKPALFANILGNKPAQQDGAKPGLFSGLTAGGAGKPFAFGSSGSDQKDVAPTEGAKPGLLGLGGLGALSAAKPFSGGSGSFSSLFGGGNSKPSALFSKPAAGANEGKEDEGSEEEDEGEDEDEPQRSPSPEADVSKSKGNYQYQQDYEKIINKKVNKFKPGQKEMLQEGEVSLNKKGESYFMIYRSKAKLIQYQGSLFPQAIKTEFLNPRKDALSVVAFSEDKTAGDGKPKMAKDIIKIMFGVPEHCEEFKKEVDKIAK